MDVGSASDTGHVRERNEDSYLVAADRGIFVVADGLGGHPAGDVASRLAVEQLDRSLDGVGGEPSATLVEALHDAHDAVLDGIREHPDRRGMGTTAVIAYLRESEAWLAHVGDSRCYLSRDGKLEQVTVDHSDGMRITQAIGTSGNIAPDVVHVDVASGDRLLLCTDGLTDMVPEDEIAEIVADGSGAQETVDRLVETALAYGGADNVTVVLVEV